eukprot:7092572-Karenia_brevis.AAC.1
MQPGVSEVFYETEDDSALHGRSYLPTSGKLVFNPGELFAQMGDDDDDGPWADVLALVPHIVPGFTHESGHPGSMFGEVIEDSCRRHTAV